MRHDSDSARKTANVPGVSGQSKPVGSGPNPDKAIADLQALVASRVRKARVHKGIPRRMLSEASGVSQRYLAQLESGKGNISISLLLRVAIALDRRIEWLLGEDDPWEAEVLHAAKLFQSADRTARDAALHALNPENRDMRDNRICLVGLRGAGKSTLGAMAARALNIPFLELNTEIEDMSGMPVAEIIALYGQEGYRRLEDEALQRMTAGYDRLLMAAAGGIVAEPETFKRLLTHYNTIWLRASPQEHMERVRAQGDERPMVGNPEAMDQLKQILQSREVLYARAQAQLDTSGITLEASLQELLDIIESKRFLD